MLSKEEDLIYRGRITARACHTLFCTPMIGIILKEWVKYTRLLPIHVQNILDSWPRILPMLRTCRVPRHNCYSCLELVRFMIPWGVHGLHLFGRCSCLLSVYIFGQIMRVWSHFIIILVISTNIFTWEEVGWNLYCSFAEYLYSHNLNKSILI